MPRSGDASNVRRHWFFIAAGGVLIAAGLFIVFRYLQVYRFIPSDFTQDYHAAEALRAGETIYGGRNHHPPLMAVLVVPLTFLPYETVFVLWGLGSLALYLACIWGVMRNLDLRLGVWWVPLIGVALVWYPFLAHVALGQWSLIIATCVFGGWALLKRNHGMASGALFGFATALKLFPALVSLYLLTQRRWRALVLMGLAFVACTAFSFAVVGPADFWTYVYEEAPSNSARYVVFPTNHSLWGMTSRLLIDNRWVEPVVDAPQVAQGINITLCGLVVGVLTLGLWRLPNAFSQDMGFAAVCVAMLLLSPLTWQNAFVLLVLPLGVLLRALQRHPTRRLRLTLLLLFILLTIPDIPWARTLITVSKSYPMPWPWGLALLVPVSVQWILLGMLLVRLPMVAWIIYD